MRMSFGYYKDADLVAMHPNSSQDGAYRYTGPVGAKGLPTGVEPTPGDARDEYGDMRADWCIPPVHPANSATLDDVRQDAYVKQVAQTGMLHESAAVLGVSYLDIESKRRESPMFDYMVNAALTTYKERVQRSVASRALYGWLEPVYQNGMIVGHRRRYDHQLLKMEAQRVNEGYRQQPSIAIQNNLDGGSSGVLIVPQREQQIDDWRDKYR